MMTRLTTVVTVCLALALLGGCVTAVKGVDAGKGVDKATPITPVIDPAARKAALAKLPPDERIRYCDGTAYIQPLAVEATISGPLRRQRSNAQQAASAILETVENWYGGGSQALRYLRDSLEEGARIEAFTKILPYSPPELQQYNYNPMNEPIYQVGSFMYALAHGYAVLTAELPEETELLAAVRRWGDRLFELTSSGRDSFGHRSKGVDRRVLIAQGWAHWGNLTGNRKALEKAYRYYVHAVRSIGSGGKDRVWRHVWPSRVLYYTNLTYGPAMVTAYALSRSGAVDVYEIAPGGGTLVEGASFYWNSWLENDQSGLRHVRSTGSRSPAWAELFVREFPNHPVAKRIDSWLAERWTPRFATQSGGGPSTCLYRRIQ